MRFDNLSGCEEPPAPSNGEVSTSNGNVLDSEATYTCDEGYELSDTDTRTCVVDEGVLDWNTVPPTCNPKSRYIYEIG